MIRIDEFIAVIAHAQFTKNCRNTYEIALTAYNVIDVELNQKIQMMKGEKTALSFIKGNPISKLAVLLKELTGEKYGYSCSDIVILSLKTEATSILAGINKISGIPILNEESKSAIWFTTAKKFKGLESCVIIIIDIDETKKGINPTLPLSHLASKGTPMLLRNDNGRVLLCYQECLRVLLFWQKG